MNLPSLITHIGFIGFHRPRTHFTVELRFAKLELCPLLQVILIIIPGPNSSFASFDGLITSICMIESCTSASQGPLNFSFFLPFSSVCSSFSSAIIKN